MPRVPLVATPLSYVQTTVSVCNTVHAITVALTIYALAKQLLYISYFYDLLIVPVRVNWKVASALKNEYGLILKSKKGAWRKKKLTMYRNVCVIHSYTVLRTFCVQ